MNNTILLESFEDPKSPKHPTRFKTSEGWMSAFDTDLCKTLKEHVGTGIAVELNITEKGNFKNIMGILGYEENTGEVTKIGKPADNKTFKKAPSFSGDDKFTTMYVSYAKDLFINLNDGKTALTEKAIMDKAIAVIKQAKEAFK